MKGKILPDFCISGRPIEAVDGVIIHYFSGKNVDQDNQFDLMVCRDLFLDLNRPRHDRQRYMQGTDWPDNRMYASAHILIGRGGEAWKLVEYDKQAYHAGASILNDRSFCNRWTIGIELVGTQDSGFTKAQYTELVNILIQLEERYQFSRDNVAGHDSVRWAALEAGAKKRPKYDPSGRKDGKGDNFDWFYLGKMWNDRVENPRGVNSIEDLEATINADPHSG